MVIKMMDYLRDTLFKVFSLSPESQRAHYLQFDRFLVVLKTTMPYLDRSAKILDVGAGAGVISLALREMGNDVSAIDIWEERSHSYDSRTEVERLVSHGVCVKNCDIGKAPFPFKDDSFDIVLLLDVFEHLSRPKKVLREIGRVLTLKGVLVLTTPNVASLKNRLMALFGRSIHDDLAYWYNSEPFYGHVREYTMDEVKQMLNWEGFQVKHASLSNCLQIPIIRQFNFKPRTLLMALYISITAAIPKFRYLMIFVGQKNESRETVT